MPPLNKLHDLRKHLTNLNSNFIKKMMRVVKSISDAKVVREVLL